MQQTYQPKRSILFVLVAIIAALAVGVLGASAAFASGGPEWLVKAAPLVGKQAITSSGGKFVLEGVTNIECASEKDTGEIIGGNPGTDKTTIKFEKCNVEGKPTCLAGNVTAEEIEVVGINTVLAYPLNKKEEAGEALDAFVPGGAAGNNTFVTFKLTGGISACGLLNNITVEVKAVGTTITKPAFEKNCGVLTKVGLLEANGTFKISKAGEEAIIGALNAETNGAKVQIPTEAELWEGTAFKKITCKLEAFGAAAAELGISDVELASKELFGWTI